MGGFGTYRSLYAGGATGANGGGGGDSNFETLLTILLGFSVVGVVQGTVCTGGLVIIGLIALT